MEYLFGFICEYIFKKKIKENSNQMYYLLTVLIIQVQIINLYLILLKLFYVTISFQIEKEKKQIIHINIRKSVK